MLSLIIPESAEPEDKKEDNTTWDMLIDNFAYIHQSRDEAGELKMRYELRGNRFIGGHFKVQ
jgi:hypothetical protein